ncbi:MAG: DNA alkylation repair protein [Candidatus Omnitrophota bacterium]
MSLTLALQKLHAYAHPAKADILQRFFKTGPGQYGAGDVFIGVKVPEIRTVAKQFSTLPHKSLANLLHSNIHEERLLALLVMVYQFECGQSQERRNLFDLYLNNTAHINNWDLVDLSAPKIIGPYLLDKNRSILTKLAQAPILWERRIAIVSTLAFIREHQFDDTFRISSKLLNDNEDLIHKATGWMLREAGKRNVTALKEFLNEHRHLMPRTMLRYAIEKFAEKERRKYLQR